MNHEQTRDAIRVMQAWLDGKAIEFRKRDSTACWTKLDFLGADWDWSTWEFRVKPDPRRWWLRVGEENEAVWCYGDRNTAMHNANGGVVVEVVEVLK